MMFMIPCHCCGSPLAPTTAYFRGNSSWTICGSTDTAPSVLFPGGDEGDFSPHEQRSTFINDPALLEQAALVYSCGYSTAESHLYHSTRSGVVARDLSSLLAAQLLNCSSTCVQTFSHLRLVVGADLLFFTEHT
jgi:hypothetical protein